MSIFRPAWAHLQTPLPDVFAPYASQAKWDHSELWNLGLPTENVATNDLEWQLDLPWWSVGHTLFAVSPDQVAAEPVQYEAQFQHTMDADMSYPIDIILRDGKWFVLDGVHRLLKAKITGSEIVSVHKLTDEDFAKITTG